MARSGLRTQALGVVGLALIAAFVAASLAVYRHTFDPGVGITVQTARAGLLLDRGSDVLLRGVVVGEVRGVESDRGGARVRVALDPAEVRWIPADATARIVPASTAGGKSVQIVAAPGPVTRPVSAGAVLRVTTHDPEIDDLFAHTVALLKSVPVAKLNVTLSAFAQALDGRGGELGQMIDNLDRYVTALNAHGGAIDTDARLSARVLQQYAALAPSLVRLTRNSTVTGRTVVSRAADLHQALVSANRLMVRGTGFIDLISAPFVTAVRELAPVVGLARTYSPEFPCMLQGWASMGTGNNSLGVRYPGAQVVMTFLPSQDRYRYPRDLPRYVDNHGPQCYTLPGNPPTAPPRRYFNDGEHVYEGGHTTHLGNPPVEFFPPGAK